MTAYVRDPVDYEGARWFASTEPLREHMPALCRSRGIRLRIHRTTDPSSLRGYRAEWRVAADRLWLVALHGSYYVFDPEGAPPPSPFEPPPGVAVKTLDTRVLFPDTDGPVLADWFTGALRITDASTSWQRVARTVDLQLLSGRVEPSV